jgi:hypothetical protein
VSASRGNHAGNHEIESLFDVNQIFSERPNGALGRIGSLDGKPNEKNGDPGKVPWASNERFGGHVDYSAIDKQVSKLVNKCGVKKKPGCVITLERGWRITLRRAEVWAAQGYIDAALPGRVRARLHDSYCRKVSYSSTSFFLNR